MDEQEALTCTCGTITKDGEQCDECKLAEAEARMAI